MATVSSGEGSQQAGAMRPAKADSAQVSSHRIRLISHHMQFACGVERPQYGQSAPPSCRETTDPLHSSHTVRHSRRYHANIGTYAFGFVIQSALTGAPLAAVALASMGFVVDDAIKAVAASLATAGLSKLGR